ncbi:cag1 [Helicobacter pylori Hp P-62]|nr:cag1 [Helicobacter pylori Hp P-62]
MSGAMGIVGIIFVAIGIFLSFSNINLVKLVEKLFKKQPKAATTVNNETQKSQAASVTNEPTEAKETKN